MKAAVLTGTNTPLVVEDVDIQGPGEREAQVRIGATGICHSDLHNIKGEWDNRTPAILGHEGAGVVEAVGEGVHHVKPGDNVILSFRPNCGRCRNCVRGIPSLCNGHDSPRQLMHDGTARVSLRGEPLFVSARLGTWAEQVVCPAEQAIPVTGDVPPEVAALIGCCVTTGVCSVTNAARVEAGDTVAVIGCGGVGLNVVQGARLVGASAIVAIDILDGKSNTPRSSAPPTRSTARARTWPSGCARSPTAAPTTSSRPSASAPQWNRRWTARGWAGP